MHQATSSGTRKTSQSIFDQSFWDERYRAHDALWSGNPNRHLVSETDGLTPGSAIDIGASVKADALDPASPSASRR